MGTQFTLILSDDSAQACTDVGQREKGKLRLNNIYLDVRTQSIKHIQSEFLLAAFWL